MIEINGLRKKYGDLEILKGIELNIDEGKVFAIIGPSGSGKSTLLRCINLLEIPEEGQIKIGGVEITAPKAPVRKIRTGIGMVFQQFNLFANKTVIENMIYAPMKVNHLSKKAAEEKAAELLKKVGLLDKSMNYPSQLSGGQKQRVAIARALMMDPSLLLFDEPTSALDPEMVKEVLQVIKELAKKNITMVIVTHEMNFAKEVADQICFVEDGKIEELAPPEEFFSHPTTKRAQEFLAKVL